MFSWICPQCGRECAPSMTECPDCSARDKTVATPAASATVPQPAAPLPPPLAAAPVALPQPKSGLPVWLMAILFAVVIGLVVAGVYLFIQSRNGSQPAALKLEQVPIAQDASLQSDPALKYLEAGGIRLIQADNKTVEVKFVVINHSAAALSDLNVRVRIVARDSAGVESVVGECMLKGISLEPYASKEFNAPLSTDKKAYELPDWQFLRATVAPAA